MGATSSTGTCNVFYDDETVVYGPGWHELEAHFTPESGCCDVWTYLNVYVASTASSASMPSSAGGDTFPYGATTTFSSTISPNPANPGYSGLVNFYDNGVLIATATPNSSTGVATSPAVLLPSGNHSITAQYTGDLFYATSALSPPLSVTVSLSSAMPYLMQVMNNGGSVSNSVPFFVLPPGLFSLSATSASAGSPDLPLTVTGLNYLPGSQVLFRGTALIPSVDYRHHPHACWCRQHC